MKNTILSALAIISNIAFVNGASLTLDNISPGNAVLLYDNAGNPLSTGRVALYSGASPTTYEQARTLSATAPLGAINLGPATALPGGLFSGAINVVNDGSLNNANLFLLVSNAAGDQFGAYDITSVFTKEDNPPPPSAPTETLNDSALITLASPRSGNVEGDFSAIGAGNAAAYALRLTAVPEPSVALLAGLAFVGGLVRRRR